MDVHTALGVALIVLLLAFCFFSPKYIRRWCRRLADLVEAAVERRWERARGPFRPIGRPIEHIAADVYRLGAHFRFPPPGTSFAKFEGRRWAYDGVLAEACAALGVEHLIGVVPPGPELDYERRRVEVLLDRAGLRLDDDLAA